MARRLQCRQNGEYEGSTSEPPFNRSALLVATYEPRIVLRARQYGCFHFVSVPERVSTRTRARDGHLVPRPNPMHLRMLAIPSFRQVTPCAQVTDAKTLPLKLLARAQNGNRHGNPISLSTLLDLN